MKQFNFICNIFLLIILLFSCDKEHHKRTYYVNGVLKEERVYLKEELKKKFEFDSIGIIKKKVFYTNGKLDSLMFFNYGIKRSMRLIFADSIYDKLYFENGKIESEGRIFNDSLAIGWWMFYHKNGLLKAKREYFITCNKSVFNQAIVFDEKGDTIFRDDDFNLSSFYDFQVTDLNNGKLKVDYNIVPISNRSFLQVGIINRDDFCVVEEKDVDTVINLSSRRGSFVVKKNKYNKGMIIDYRTTHKDVVLKEGVSTLSRRMFFDLDDYIIENPDE